MSAGGPSHVYPMVPLGRALAARGHRVAIAVPEAHAGAVEELGWPRFRLPSVEGNLAATPAATFRAHTRQQERARAAVGGYLAQAAGQVAALRDVARDWGADVLVRETAAWSGWLAGDLLGLPVAVVDYAPTPTRLLVAMMGDLFGEARRRAGLPPGPALTGLEPALHLLAGPPGWFPSQVVGPTSHLFRPELVPAEGPPPPALRGVGPADRLVYITFGTMFDRTPGVFEMAFDAVRGQAQAIATCGPHGAEVAVPTEGVVVERFLPRAAEAAILDRADAVVCHAGYGTLMAALARGIPVVSVPLAGADNADRAARIEALGVGVVVREHERSAATVRDGLTRVLREPQLRGAARRLAASLDGQPPLADAAPLVEQLVAGRRPALREEERAGTAE